MTELAVSPVRHREISDDLAALLDSTFADSVPVAGRLLELIEARGWTGWTKNKRIS